MMKNLTAEIIDSLNNCSVETHRASKITILKWPKELLFLIYPTDSLIVDGETLQAKVNQKKFHNLMKRPVSVRFLEMSWFNAERKNFIALAGSLQGLTSNVYSSEFVAYLLDLFWAQT